MANVKITEKFIYAVTRVARESYAKRIQEAEAFFMDQQEFAKAVEAAFMRQSGLRKRWAAIPDSWKDPTYRVSWGRLNGYKPQSMSSISVPPQRRAPKCLADNNPDIDDEEFEPLARAFEKWDTELIAMREERDNFEATVKQFIKRHVSLKQALQEWPEFWDLVPQEYKGTYLKQPERNTHKVEDAGIDFDALNGRLVVAKLVEK